MSDLRTSIRLDVRISNKWLPGESHKKRKSTIYMKKDLNTIQACSQVGSTISRYPNSSGIEAPCKPHVIKVEIFVAAEWVLAFENRLLGAEHDIQRVRTRFRPTHLLDHTDFLLSHEVRRGTLAELPVIIQVDPDGCVAGAPADEHGRVCGGMADTPCDSRGPQGLAGGPNQDWPGRFSQRRKGTTSEMPTGAKLSQPMRPHVACADKLLGQERSLACVDSFDQEHRIAVVQTNRGFLAHELPRPPQPMTRHTTRSRASGATKRAAGRRDNAHRSSS